MSCEQNLFSGLTRVSFVSYEQLVLWNKDDSETNRLNTDLAWDLFYLQDMHFV